MVGNEVHGTTAELWPVVVVCSVAITLNRRVVVALRVVDVCAEGADPLVAVLDPPHERVDVRPTLLAPYDRVIFE